MNSIQLICFDAAGTLIQVNGSVGSIYAQTAKNHGLELCATQLEHDFKQAFKMAPSLSFPKAKEKDLFQLEKTWWENLVGKVIPPSLFQNKAHFEGFFDDLYRVFSKKESWKLYDDVLPTLKALQRKSIPMWVLSNFDSRLLGILTALQISNYFEKIIFSSAHAFAKPDIEFFQNAVPQNLNPSEVLMIGDHRDLDIIPAKEMGMKTAWLQREGAGPGEKGVYASLSDIPF